jgi:Na+-translocating ferredoxin:NAD+ oxidoreductase RNF subunit RnfB
MVDSANIASVFSFERCLAMIDDALRVKSSVDPLENAKPDHHMRIDEKLCNGCVLCLRACPTRAIRVRNHKLAKIEGFCIDCGECLRVCPRGAVRAVTTGIRNIERSKTILVVSPVFYAQFGEGVSPGRVNRALKKMGFLDAVDEFEALETFSTAVEIYLKETKDNPRIPRPLISPVCPVVVRIVAYRFPSLLAHFPPILRPREIAARTIREKSEEKYGFRANEIRVFHVFPCSAKMMAIENPILVHDSYLDGAIGMNEIYLGVKSQLKTDKGPADFPAGFGLGLAWGKSGGEIATMADGNFLAVSGIPETVRYLEKIEMGLLDGIDYVELRPTPAGCIGGPLTVVDRYQAKHTIERTILRTGVKRSTDPVHIQILYREGRLFTNKEPGQLKAGFKALPLAEAIERQSRIEQLYQTLPMKECGVCGSPDCRTLAEDVIDGKAVLDDCVYLSLK